MFFAYKFWDSCWSGICFWAFREFISFSSIIDWDSTYCSFFLILSSFFWKLYLCISISFLCACLTGRNSCVTSCIITCFYSYIFFFLTWSSWAAICLMAVSANFLALVVACVSCLTFNRFVAFSLVALRTPKFTNWSLSAFMSNWRRTCQFWCSALYSCSPAVATVAHHLSNALFSMTSYSSIIQLFYTYALLEIISKLSKNDIEYSSTIRYKIKNRQLFSYLVICHIPKCFVI